MDKIKVYSPGSIGNFGCGFDVFGLAIEAVGDTVEVSRNSSGKVKIIAIHGDDSITTNPDKNIVTVGVKTMLKEQGCNDGFDFVITKGVAAGSGLGSSGCSATAGVFAVNELLGRPYTKHQLLRFAAVGETLASDSLHYDNIAPSMLGGFNIVRSSDPLEILKVAVPENLYLAIVRPGVVIKTGEAKKILGDMVPLKTTVKQFGNLSGLIIGLHDEDIDLIGRSVADYIATPARSKLIPRFNEARMAALDAGATGFNISGSGPAMFAVCQSERKAELVVKKLKEVYHDDPKAAFYITKADEKGTRVVA